MSIDQADELIKGDNYTVANAQQLFFSGNLSKLIHAFKDPFWEH